MRCKKEKRLWCSGVLRMGEEDLTPRLNRTSPLDSPVRSKASGFRPHTEGSQPHSSFPLDPNLNIYAWSYCLRENIFVPYQYMESTQAVLGASLHCHLSKVLFQMPNNKDCRVVPEHHSRSWKVEIVDLVRDLPPLSSLWINDFCGNCKCPHSLMYVALKP